MGLQRGGGLHSSHKKKVKFYARLLVRHCDIVWMNEKCTKDTVEKGTDYLTIFPTLYILILEENNI